MCGIAGFISQEADMQGVLRQMLQRIAHRGPDDEGFFIKDDVALGHKRLSIIDLDYGRQPMYSKDGSLVVVFNGEIYNYLELREELKDYPFQTTSDTEVLLYGYRQWGQELPSHLRGMFAFAIYDLEQKSLFCARDPFGIKPFYYYQRGQSLLFASESKAFLDHPRFEKKFNESLLPSYLAFSFTPGEDTFFAGVKRLPPGHNLFYQNHQLTINRYYQLQFKPQQQDYQQTVDAIAAVMSDSVQHHLLSDVEVGAFLSSGIDSSYLVSLAKPDKTYTVGYDLPRYNEADYAADLAGQLNISNTCYKVSKTEYIANLEKVMYHLDEPTSDPAVVSLYCIARLASREVKVVLSGEGADEFFGGYNCYKETVEYAFYNKIPFVLRHLIAKICSHLPAGRGVNFLVRRGQTLEKHYVGVNRVWSAQEIDKLLKIPVLIDCTDITAPVYQEFKHENTLNKMQAIDITFWLANDILHKADKLGMANSLEMRVPFTDTEVFKIASSLPPQYKVNKQNTKVALRDAAKKVIPNEAYQRKKLGFPVPIRDWIREEDIYCQIKEYFTSPTAEKYFNTRYLLKLLAEHKNKEHDHYRKIWNIFCFLKWYQIYFE